MDVHVCCVCMCSYNTHWYGTSLASEARGYKKNYLPPSLPPSLPPPFSYICRRITATKLRPNLLTPSQLTSSGCLFSEGSLHGVGWPPLFLPATDPRPRNPLCCEMRVHLQYNAGYCVWSAICLKSTPFLIFIIVGSHL